MNKIVVYTAIMGGFDNVIEPKVITPHVDYICFTDSDNMKSNVWKFVKVTSENNNSRMKAREIKLNPHIFLKDYKYSIWVDGNVEILKDLTSLIHDKFFVKKSLVSTFKHPDRDCVYQEFLMCMYNRNDSSENFYKQLKLCVDNQYPSKSGLCETNVMFRIHNDEKCTNIMDQWWACVKNNTIRDQLSFNYILHINNIKYDELLGNARGNSEYFNCREHKNGIFKSIKISLKKYFKIG